MLLWLPIEITTTKRFKESIRQNEKKQEALKEFFEDPEYPIILGFHFVLPDKKYYKYTSLINVVVKGLADLKYIKNDSVRHINPVILPVEEKGKPARWFTIDKKYPGVNLSIIQPYDIVEPPPPSNSIIMRTDDVPRDETLTLKGGSILG